MSIFEAFVASRLRRVAASVARLVVFIPLFAASVSLVGTCLAITQEDLFDSDQWLTRARYEYRFKKDRENAISALVKSLKVNPLNSHAEAYLRAICEKETLPYPKELETVKPVDVEPMYPKARTWYDNGLEAYERKEYETAYQCFRLAFNIDNRSKAIYDMLLATQKELALRKYLQELKLESVSFVLDLDEKLAPDEDEIKMAELEKKLEGREVYDPESSMYWVSQARFYMVSEKKLEKASRAAGLALVFMKDNVRARDLQKEIDEALVKESAEKNRLVEEERKQVEEERKKKADEEMKRRQEIVREIKEDRPSETIDVTGKGREVKNPFLLDDFITTMPLVPTVAERKSGPVEDAREVRELVYDNQGGAKKLDVEIAQKFIADHTEKSLQFLSEGQGDAALYEYESVARKRLELDPDDYAGYYNLMLIHRKLKEPRKSIAAMVELIDSLNRHRPRYEFDKDYRKIYDTVDCFVKGACIHGALVAYNEKRKRSMNRHDFNISVLKKEGLINIDGKREISLALTDKGMKPRLVTFEVDGISCKSHGYFRLSEDGLVECTRHGANPIIQSTYQFDRFE
jgi:tetratricopeptide (TPR) repeat protein